MKAAIMASLIVLQALLTIVSRALRDTGDGFWDRRADP